MAKGNMTDDILKVLIEEDAIAEKVKAVSYTHLTLPTNARV